MNVQFEKMFTDKGNLSFIFTPMVALSITEGKYEFGIGWLFWLLIIKSE